MTQLEAMKQWLEALQKIYIAPEHEEYIRVWWPACEEAITSLRQAIAVAEQHKQAQPSQWVEPREWRGLTPQERDEINEQVFGVVPHHVAFHHVIEAKLKEKNGYA